MTGPEKKGGSQRTRPRKKGGRRRSVKAKKEISAGGIVFKRTSRGVRIALILDPFGKWAFAKGHVEEGETIKDDQINGSPKLIHALQIKTLTPDQWAESQNS